MPNSRFDRPVVPLADAILTEQIFPGGEIQKVVREHLYQRVVHRVIADEVAEYSQTHFPDTYKMWLEIPTLAPPFSDLWVEMQHGGLRWGTIFSYSEQSDESRVHLDNTFAASFPEWRWRVDITLVKDFRGLISYMGEFTALLDYDGKLMGHPDKSLSLMFHDVLQWGDKHQQHCLMVLAPCLLAVGFMHCTNLVYDAVRISPRVEKEHQRVHGRPMLTYKTIRIVPFKPTRVPLASATGEERPWHKVRGHFADYRRIGLFGKHRGIFWIPDHGRGNPKVGIVEHLYEVKQPEGT